MMVVESHGVVTNTCRFVLFFRMFSCRFMDNPILRWNREASWPVLYPCDVEGKSGSAQYKGKSYSSLNGATQNYSTSVAQIQAALSCFGLPGTASEPDMNACRPPFPLDACAALTWHM